MQLMTNASRPSEIQYMVALVDVFTNRRRHTRYIGDWSSDVCSSDLVRVAVEPQVGGAELGDLRLVEPGQEIGRASCRERVQISVVAVSLKKNGKAHAKAVHVSWDSAASGSPSARRLCG